MNVIRANVMGFCMGVRRAVEMTRQASTQNTGDNTENNRVYTLGPLIHNPVVLKALENQGVSCLKDDEIPQAGSTVVIRAHGVSPGIEAELTSQGVRIVDATCPHVKQSQAKARFYAERGYRVFLAGEKDHSEIEGIQCYVKDSGAPCFVVGTPGEAESAAAGLSLCESACKTVLIGQTTISPEEYRAIGEAILRYFPSLEILDTICGATEDRQKALRELCAQVDAVIIIGGRESANTQRLFSLTRQLGKKGWLVETAEDIPPEVRTYNTVGLSAGASTPECLVDEIEKVLSKY